MKLEDLGWNAYWEAMLAEHNDEQPGLGAQAGRVARMDGQQATVWGEQGERRLDVPTNMRDGGVVTGDWVAVVGGDEPRIGAVLSRRTELRRRAAGRRVRKHVLAANVDDVFIVSSMDTDFSERRLERYLTAIYDCGARPVVVLTKAALTEVPDDFVRRAQSVAMNVDIVAVDLPAGKGREQLQAQLGPGKTVVLVGSSGVGKSTLLNHLLEISAMDTAPVRASDGTGQHTTSHREMFVLPNGSTVIDTPGLREFALWSSEDGLDSTFTDVEALARTCRFRDCSHENEPGCAVQAAITAGDLHAGRLHGFRDLRAEIQRTQVQIPEHERRKKDRALGRMIREVQKHKRGRR